ncbi:hypothetical protein [Coleofasciculus sp. FACHB-129]|uniref:hypothetical protein n=1 Tax=Coleofasciculus sp. FACHB-129 TaxID=2692785 RepID=UPI001687DED7|nr:hypothetical protein [Coleofasciculus sp. FACHB-129]
MAAGSQQQVKIQHQFIAYPGKTLASLAFSSGNAGMRREGGIFTGSHMRVGSLSTENCRYNRQ